MDILFEIYKDNRTVFRINDIALLLNTDDVFLRKKLNNLVKKGKLLNPRRGIYAKRVIIPKNWRVCFIRPLTSHLKKCCLPQALF